MSPRPVAGYSPCAFPSFLDPGVYAQSRVIPKHARVSCCQRAGRRRVGLMDQAERDFGFHRTRGRHVERIPFSVVEAGRHSVVCAGIDPGKLPVRQGVLRNEVAPPA